MLQKNALKEYWDTKFISDDRIDQWCRFVASMASNEKMTYSNAYKILLGIFSRTQG